MQFQTNPPRKDGFTKEGFLRFYEEHILIPAYQQYKKASASRVYLCEDVLQELIREIKARTNQLKAHDCWSAIDPEYSSLKNEDDLAKAGEKHIPNVIRMFELCEEGISKEGKKRIQPGRMKSVMQAECLSPFFC